MTASSRNPHAAAITAAMVGAGALIAQQVSGKATRDALFLTHLSVRTLPLVMIASAVVSLFGVLLFSREMTRRTPARAVPMAFALSAALLLGEWAVSFRSPAIAALALYVHMGLFGAPLISGFWSVLNERFDPFTAKKVVGRVGAGATFGGLLGGAATLGAADLVRATTMLPVLAALNLVTIWGVRRLHAGAPALARKEEDDRPTATTAGLRLLREVSYLRSLALIIGLAAVGEVLLDYVLKAEAAAAFTRGADLMSFFAAFHTAVGVGAFAVQALLSRTVLERLGLAGTVALRPAAVLSLGTLAAVFPRLWSVALARGAEAVVGNSLFRSGYELLFTPLPQERKRPAKAIVDVGFDRLGTSLGSLVVIVVLALHSAAPSRLLLLLGTASAILALLAFQRVHRGYVGTLADNLRSGAVRLDPAEVMDSTTRLTMSGTAIGLSRDQLLEQIQAFSQTGHHALAAAETRVAPVSRELAAAPMVLDPVVRAAADLGSADRARIRRVLREGSLDPRLVAHALPLLARDDVFQDALQAIRQVAPRVTGQLLDALLDPEGDLVVRRRIPRVLKSCPTPRAADGLLLGLLDDRFEIRYPCGLALARITARNPEIALPRKQVFTAVQREIEGGRRIWDTGAGRAQGAAAREDRVLEHVFTLLSLALEREPVQMAYRALVASDESLRGTALEYLENVLPDAIRDTLWFYLGVRERVRRERSPQQLVDDLRRSMSAALGGQRRPDS